jgi:hypothetical protein
VVAFTFAVVLAHATGKMPSHSDASWKTTMFFRFKAQMEEAHHKGRIQYNKRKRQESSKASESMMSVGAPYTAGSSGSPIEPIPPTPSRDELEQRDIDDIVNFFVNGEDEEFGDGEERNQNRDAIFGKLDKRVRQELFSSRSFSLKFPRCPVERRPIGMRSMASTSSVSSSLWKKRMQCSLEG